MIESSSNCNSDSKTASDTSSGHNSPHTKMLNRHSSLHLQRNRITSFAIAVFRILRQLMQGIGLLVRRGRFSSDARSRESRRLYGEGVLGVDIKIQVHMARERSFPARSRKSHKKCYIQAKASTVMNRCETRVRANSAGHEMDKHDVKYDVVSTLS